VSEWVGVGERECGCVCSPYQAVMRMRLCDVKNLTLLDTRLTDGGRVVSPTHRPCFTPQKYLYASGTDFCYRLNRPQGLVRPKILGKLEIHPPLRVSNPRPSGLVP
jgi:hypothetical protein